LVQLWLRWITLRVRSLQTPARILVLNLLGFFVVQPCLIAAHAMAAHQLDWRTGTRGVHAVVVGHYLLSFRVRKHLVAAKAVAARHGNVLATLATKGVQAVL